MSLTNEHGGAGRAVPESPLDPELTERPKRRPFSAEQKLRILEQADAYEKPGGVGNGYGQKRLAWEAFKQETE